MPDARGDRQELRWGVGLVGVGVAPWKAADLRGRDFLSRVQEDLGVDLGRCGVGSSKAALQKKDNVHLPSFGFWAPHLVFHLPLLPFLLGLFALWLLLFCRPPDVGGPSALSCALSSPYVFSLSRSSHPDP